jgi:hypothetical protein
MFTPTDLSPHRRCPSCGIPGPSDGFDKPHHRPDGRTRCMFVYFFDVRFLEEDTDGDFPHDDVRAQVIDCLPDKWDREEGKTGCDLAVDTVRANYLGHDGCTDWFYQPDGSQLVDDATGERSEITGHLHGFTKAEKDAIYAAVGRGY